MRTLSITLTGLCLATGAADAQRRDPALEKAGIYAKTAPRPRATAPIVTRLPLELAAGSRIALIGNTLFERAQLFGHFETLLHQRFPKHGLVVRNLAWSADTPDLQPRPANFADLEQHLGHERIDVIFAAFGFNESFAGAAGIPAFRESLTRFVSGLRAKACNGRTGPRIVLVSPIANENVAGVPAADNNNDRIRAYAEVIRAVAADQEVGYADVFTATLAEMTEGDSDLTLNGVHLLEPGYALFARTLLQAVFGGDAPAPNERLRQAVIDKNRQYFRRYRPLNTFYYTGARNKSYGYLDFLPAMRSFDVMVANRERRIRALAAGETVPDVVDDSNVPAMPKPRQSRGANKWMSAADERAAFKVDPRFEVALFAGEEQFPDIAAPIQMRWDGRGRLWVSCSTTYPHVYPGNEPNDKIVVLEDTDGDGRADKSTVFADDLHIPLSFEFGDGGLYVSEMPHLTFLKDTDGDGRADLRRVLLSGFGTEDSHHALHDFVWTPDGDLVFRESIFHHSQVETPYGPVRQVNSGWFRFEPRYHRLTSFGTYHSTNPWGVTFDDWGQHVASHPVFASAFHALDPPYPKQHPRPAGLRAYSGTCGQEFIDFPTFPDELQGAYVKARYKPTNRLELHEWRETPFGYDERYIGDLLFSSNLSFIPVDVRFGPRGALYVCDWYNPIKGHAQYSLRDDRRDRHSGRIWRITAKGKPLQEPPRIAGASIERLLEVLERREYRYRYWAKRELRDREPRAVQKALDRWVAGLDRAAPRFRHHQVEALWMYRGIRSHDASLLREVLGCSEHHARAAATRQLRYLHAHLDDAIPLLRRSAGDPSPLVRLEAAVAASYIGTRAALDAMLAVFEHPMGGHLAYAARSALGSRTLRRHWVNDPGHAAHRLLRESKRKSALAEPSPNARQAQFDSRKGLAVVRISCVPERMKYSLERFAVVAGQPVKLVFTNPDATDHNLVIVEPGALEEVGRAANEMAKHPRFARSNFVPRSKRAKILRFAPMIGPTRRKRVHVLRFEAPQKAGIYPYVCTFPGHWVVMTGEMIVVADRSEVDAALAARAAQAPQVVKHWMLADFENDMASLRGRPVMRGMKAYMLAGCNKCHTINGHGSKLGPDLTKVRERYRGRKLLQQILDPSSEIHPDYKSWEIVTKDDDFVVGTIAKETESAIHVVPNQLAPDDVTIVLKSDIQSKAESEVSAMPTRLVSTLTKEQVLDLVAFLEAGGYELPAGLKHKRR